MITELVLGGITRSGHTVLYKLEVHGEGKEPCVLSVATELPRKYPFEDFLVDLYARTNAAAP